MRFISLIALTLIAGACSIQPDGPAANTMDTPTPDIDKLWNFQDPAASEAAFRGLLPVATPLDNPSHLAELLSQIARAQGLQQKYDEAHATLDQAQTLTPQPNTRAQVRVLLERGRVINSSGKPDESVPIFQQAFDQAQTNTLEYYAVDAAHMLGIVTKGDTAIAWNEKALALAETATDPRARKWIEVLCNNLGWTYHDLGRHEDALTMFETQLPLLQSKGKEKNLGICRWSIAKTYRHLGRVDEALTIQLELLDAPQLQDDASKGYTHEELGECLLLLDRPDDARAHFAQAWQRLHADPWLSRDEPDRLERMKKLGGL